MAELVKLCTTWCGKIIVVVKIDEKAAEPRSGYSGRVLRRFPVIIILCTLDRGKLTIAQVDRGTV